MSRPINRRYARECALHALYSVEISKLRVPDAIADAIEHFDDVVDEMGESTSSENSLPPQLQAFTEKIVNGVWLHRKEIDERLDEAITEYDLDRVANVDRNVLRVAAYELFYEPAIPPAVTINEAIEIARKYSTVESGRFVNGVLGRLVRESPKANWDPATAPQEFFEEESLSAPEPVIEEEVVQEDSEEGKKASRFGVWKLRSEDEN